MKRYIAFFLIGFLGWTMPGIGQRLAATVSYSGSAPFLEPDPTKLIVKLSEQEFVALAKVKGGLNSASEFLLEKYDLSLKISYSTIVSLAADEDIIRFFYNGDQLVLLTNVHDLGRKKAQLKAYFFDVSTGEKKEDKTVIDATVTDWVADRYKGAVKESFRNNIYSYLNQNFIIPVQYQFCVSFSPDDNKILVYIYDYGQKTLAVNAILFDSRMQQLHEARVPIDNNFINYGLYPNNRGDFYILNVDRLGRLVLVQYNIADGTNKFLDLQYSSSVREGLVLRQLNDDICYVANINVKNGVMLGVMYTKFNFQDNLIEKINYYELSNGLKQTVNTARAVKQNVSSQENWKNYEITHFLINEFEKIILVLEKRELTSGNFSYSGASVNDIAHWGEKTGRLNTEGMLLFAFNREDAIIWENFYLKSQLADVNVGLLGASVELDNTAEGKIRMVYANADGASGVFNALKYVEWDEYSGSRVKELDLENKDKLSLMRSHLAWWDDKLILVGRKGMIGKKTVMNLYDLK